MHEVGRTRRGAVRHGDDAEAAAAFGGEEGDHVGGPGGQAGQIVAVAPGAHPGAIGPPCIRRRGPPGVGVRGDAGVASVPSSSGMMASAASSNQAHTRAGRLPDMFRTATATTQTAPLLPAWRRSAAGGRLRCVRRRIRHQQSIRSIRG
jgi:hypothetical protein